MNNLKFLKKYFIAATAESENTFLDEVFVTSEDFYNIIEPIPGTMRILVGNKGSGKSALLERLLKRAVNDQVPAIRITPTDLNELDFEEKISPAKIISIVKASVIKHIAIKFGETKKGFMSEEDARFFREAQKNGTAQTTGIDRFCNMIRSIGKEVIDIDFNAICNSDSNAMNMKSSVKKHLDNNQKVFYVLLDDIDQIASIERTDRNDIIWGVLLAMFSIAQELPNVFPIITVRTEIWRQLTIDNGNRDKYDQIRNMIYPLKPTREDMIKIVKKRLLYCVKNDIGEAVTADPYPYFFEGADCKLPSSNQRRTWDDYFISSSRGNPRDIIQLVNHLIVYAIENQRNQINDMDVENTALIYSEERVRDLISQNQDFCTGLDHIIRSFSQEEKFDFSSEEIKVHLSNAFGGGNVTINRKTLHSNDSDDIFTLWDTLNNIGFLNAQTVDNRQTKFYSFLPYDKYLIRQSRCNDMQKYTWHIHPCYRSYLIDIQKNDRYRTLSSTLHSNSSRKYRKKRKRR